MFSVRYELRFYTRSFHVSLHVSRSALPKRTTNYPPSRRAPSFIKKSPQNNGPPPTYQIQPECSNSFLSHIIKHATSHHLTSFHFSTLYLASSLLLPEGQAGTVWKTCPSPLPRNNKCIAPQLHPTVCFSRIKRLSSRFTKCPNTVQIYHLVCGSRNRRALAENGGLPSAARTEYIR